MIDTNALRGIIVSKGLTQQDVAKSIGMSSKTFYGKMKKGVFGSDELEKIANLLDMDNPSEIFFAKEVTSQVTK